MAKLAHIINALSLDAVAVSVLWQYIFCISFTDRAPSLAQSVSLGLTVWLIYCADRLLDAARMDASNQATYRHQFHRLHRRGLTIAWMMILVIDALVVCFGIEEQIQVLGIGLAAGVLVYGAGIHLAPTPLRWIPKELQVGFLFACGVSLVSWPSIFSSPDQQFSMLATLPLLLTLGLASLLFTLNCIFVAQCEIELDRAQGFDSFPRRWIDLNRSSVGLILVASTIGLAIASLTLTWFAWVPWTAGVALAISFAFLLAATLARFLNPISVDRYFGKKLPAGLVADSALFLPPLLFVPWLN